MLTDEQRKELEELGAPKVRNHLVYWGGGRGVVVGGFKCGGITRGDISDWLEERHQSDEARRRWTLFWAIVGGCAGVASVIAAIYFRMK
jgi:hypothetical protein